MQLERDEFVVTYDAATADEKLLIETIRKAGYTSRVASNAAVPKSEPQETDAVDDALLNDAFVRAKAENKPLVLDFHAAWCVPCRRMETETFADPKVAAMLERVVFIKIDTDEHPAVAKQFGVIGLPDVRLLLPDGTEHQQLLDFQDAELFADSLKELLESVEQKETE